MAADVQCHKADLEISAANLHYTAYKPVRLGGTTYA